MATLVSENPAVYQGPVMATQKVLVTNGQSWSAGEFLVTTSGALVAAASNAVKFRFYALTAQTNPGNATTYATVGVVTGDHVFVMNELDGTVATTSIGALHSLDVTTNKHTVDTADNTHPCFVVVGIAALDQPMTDVAADVKGRLYVKVIQTVLDT